MNVPDGWDVGAATHTGKVRSANEDDFALLFVEPDLRLLVIADGMGGVSGGAEASRTAVRALCGEHLAAAKRDGSAEAHETMAAGFSEAGRRVSARSRELPALRDMGTTLTAARWLPGRLVVGHVGDTRLVRWRAGRLEVLTRDHVLHPGQSILTNCIGAGQVGASPDVFEVALAAGDGFALVTDGVWNTIEPAALTRTFQRGSAQAVAESLVRQALEAGAPDNATAVVFRPACSAGPRGSFVPLALPRDELSGTGDLLEGGPPLRAPRWPWFVLAVSVVLCVWAWLRFGRGA